MAVQRAVPQPDRSLSKTLAVPDGVVANKYSGSPVWRPGISKQIINSIGQAPEETGIIPTTGIAVGSNQYLNFMSIRNWDNPGSWSTNFSATAMSTDNGENWGVYPGTIRPPGGGQRELPDGGVPQARSRRSLPLHLRHAERTRRLGVRVASRPRTCSRPHQVRVLGRRRGLVPGNPAAATPVIPGPVGEMSAQYNTYLKQYLVLYCNGPNDVVMRTAPAPQGPWGPEQMLVSSVEIPGGIYAPLLHPWSTGKELYYNLSLWSAYNVMLMKTVLP